MLGLHHKINFALVGLAPISFGLGGAFQVPFDLLLGIALPLHGHIGMNLVATDYAKKFFGKSAVGPTRVVLAGITVATTLGLLKLNLAGPGLTETIKSFWRPKPQA